MPWKLVHLQLLPEVICDDIFSKIKVVRSERKFSYDKDLEQPAAFANRPQTGLRQWHKRQLTYKGNIGHAGNLKKMPLEHWDDLAVKI